MKKSLIKFICKTCNKEYSSYQSLWNHNKKFHVNTNVNNVNTNVNTNVNNVNTNVNNNVNNVNKTYNCLYCNKIFLFRQSKYLHEKKYCKNKFENNKDEKEELKDNIENKFLIGIIKNCYDLKIEINAKGLIIYC